MKVCVIAGREFFYPFDQRLYKEMIALKAAGHKVTLVTPDPEDGNTEVDGIPVIKVTNRGRGPTAPRMVRACKNVNCEVYHAHEFDGGYVGAVLKLLTGRHVFYDVHDNVPGLIADLKNNPRLEKIYDKIERRMIRVMKGLILAGESLAPRYKSLHDHMVVVNNYPMLELFKGNSLENERGEDKTLNELAQKLEGKFTVGYVGGLSERRGVFEMIEALHLLENNKNISLLLIGSFDRTEAKEKAEKLIQKYDLQNRILIQEWVDYRKLPTYLELFDAGLVIFHPLPWMHDILPTKMYDYMASSKPIIASKSPRVEKLVKDSKCGILVDYDNHQNIADAITSLHDSEEQCKKLGKAGLKAAQEKYNWALEGEKLISFYSKQLHSNAR
ncbi:MAG: glycosyltransferase family 4 protein [Thermoplasmata archaeon]|nr:MAG: glycosyltransferase family 4 protein [Thermoplasmata archaeon]